MRKLRRDDRIRLVKMGENQFEGVNRHGDVVLNDSDDYFIYMQNVNFIGGNIVEGRYLGDLTEKSPMLDDKCKTVEIDDNEFKVNGERVRTARMVAVNNKKRVIVIIDQR